MSVLYYKISLEHYEFLKKLAQEDFYVHLIFRICILCVPVLLFAYTITIIGRSVKFYFDSDYTDLRIILHLSLWGLIWLLLFHFNIPGIIFKFNELCFGHLFWFVVFNKMYYKLFIFSSIFPLIFLIIFFLSQIFNSLFPNLKAMNEILNKAN